MKVETELKCRFCNSLNLSFYDFVLPEHMQYGGRKTTKRIRCNNCYAELYYSPAYVMGSNKPKNLAGIVKEVKDGKIRVEFTDLNNGFQHTYIFNSDDIPGKHKQSLMPGRRFTWASNSDEPFYFIFE